jgi:hypothetical protein
MCSTFFWNNARLDVDTYEKLHFGTTHLRTHFSYLLMVLADAIEHGALNTDSKPNSMVLSASYSAAIAWTAGRPGSCSSFLLIKRLCQWHTTPLTLVDRFQ